MYTKNLSLFTFLEQEETDRCNSQPADSSHTEQTDEYSLVPKWETQLLKTKDHTQGSWAFWHAKKQERPFWKTLENVLKKQLNELLSFDRVSGKNIDKIKISHEYYITNLQKHCDPLPGLNVCWFYNKPACEWNSRVCHFHHRLFCRHILFEGAADMNFTAQQLQHVHQQPRAEWNRLSDTLIRSLIS